MISPANFPKSYFHKISPCPNAGEPSVPRSPASSLLRELSHQSPNEDRGADTAGWEPERTKPALFFPVFNVQKEERP